MVVTEIGKYPPSAIPQIIREFENSDIIGKIIPPKNEWTTFFFFRRKKKERKEKKKFLLQINNKKLIR